MPRSVCSALRETQLRKVILIMRKLYFRTIYGRGRIMILVFFYRAPLFLVNYSYFFVHSYPHSEIFVSKSHIRFCYFTKREKNKTKLQHNRLNSNQNISTKYKHRMYYIILYIPCLFQFLNTFIFVYFNFSLILCNFSTAFSPQMFIFFTVCLVQWLHGVTAW